MQPGHQRPAEQAADNPAVDCEPAVPDIEHAHGIFDELVAAVEDDIVDARAHDAADQAEKHRVDELVLIEVKLFAAFQRIEKRKQKAGRNNDPVPPELMPADGKRDRVDGKAEPQTGKLNMIHKRAPPFLPAKDIFAFREPAVSGGRPRARNTAASAALPAGPARRPRPPERPRRCRKTAPAPRIRAPPGSSQCSPHC